jgi:uncharacterized protein YdhG (YjbR/CyaY superfamily)
MAAAEVDAYLAALVEPHRGTLESLRATIRDLQPEAEEGLSYGCPAFKVGGRAVAGFAAYKHHLSYLPHSGAVLDELADEVRGYECSKGALKFAVDEPLPRGLVARLVEARRRELGLAP